MSASKSVGQIRNKMNKFENNESLYDGPRHNDVRSPNMAPGPVGNSNAGGAGSNDQMSAMMNMFNPMMAAFIQQLASGAGIQGNGAEPNGVGPVSAPGVGGGGMHQSASWSHGGGPGAFGGQGGGGGQNGGGGGGNFQNGRFKGEKNFVNN